MGSGVDATPAYTTRSQGTCRWLAYSGRVPTRGGRRGLRRRSKIILVALAAVLVAGGLLGWIAVRGLAAHGHLLRAQTDLGLAREAIADGDVPAARTILRRAGDETSRARDLTHDPVWTAAGAVPWLGRTPRAASVVADVTDDIVRRALPDLATAAEDLDPTTLLGAGAQVDLARVERARPLVEDADRTVMAAARRLRAVQTPQVGPVASGLARVRDQVSDLAALTGSAARAARLLPPMLGAQAPRRYLVAVLNPAEARGTGGFLSAYGIVEANDGQLRLRRLASNSDLRVPLPDAPIDLGPDYTHLYGDESRRWVNGNLSPHFPYAGRIWSAHYERQFGQPVDGVLTVDPFVLGALLDATGPVAMPDGTRVTGDEAPDFVMRGIYERFPDESSDLRRDAYLILLGSRVLERLLSGQGDPREVLSALAESAGEGRLRLWSRVPSEQRDLRATSLSGSVPATDAPYLAVVVNNGGGNKLDYYLDRRVRYRLGPCRDGRRTGLASITLTNSAPATGLPPYVLGGRLDPLGGGVPARGTNRLLGYVFATQGARLVGGELDDEPLRIRTGRERGHPVFSFTVDVAPGQSRTMELQIEEPARPGELRLAVQPLARAQHSVVDSPVCHA